MSETSHESPAASVLVEARMLRRSIDMVIQQSRIGLIAVLVITLALGGLFVPTVGWRLYLAWFLPVVSGFLLRQYWFERIRRHPGPVHGLQLTMITSVSAFTGWLVMLCLPMFGPYLPEHRLVFLSGLMLAWIAGAVSVLGVQPRVYGIYLVACLATVMSALWSRSSTSEWLVMGSAMLFGGLLMYRLAQGVRSLLNESVADGVKSETLASRLDQALDAQTSAFEARSRFLAAASHDLKQPVQALTLLVSVLRRTTDDLRRQEVIKEIDQATQSIDTMFSSLMDMARIDAGSMEAHNKALELMPLLHTVLTAFPRRCEQKELRFHLKAQAAPVVLADPILLQRVVGNLLENALKYTPQGSITVTVSVHRDHAVIDIADTGIGMTPEEMPGLYTAFVRGQAAQRLGVPGLGLGLAIARHMSELMGSPLTVRSAPDMGTTVSLWLPLSPDREILQPPTAEQPALAGEHVVVVEDDAMLRAAMAHWLEEAGARVTAAANGPALWPQIDRLPAPTLAVLDFNLGPDRATGSDVLVQLRQRFPGLPAVMVTGESAETLAPPDVPVLRKPIGAEGLSKALMQARRPRPG